MSECEHKVDFDLNKVVEIRYNEFVNVNYGFCTICWKEVVKYNKEEDTLTFKEVV